MTPARFTSILAVLLLQLLAHVATAKDAQSTDWGEVIYDTGGDGIIELQVSKPPADGRLSLPTPFANITQAYASDDKTRKPLSVFFNKDATTIHVGVPKGVSSVTLETAEKTVRRGDGRIIFSALDSKVTGSKAKLETHPGNHRVGFWVNLSDVVSWDYTASAPRTYDVELTYSLAGGSGNDIAISYAGTELTGTIKPTGTWYAYTTKVIGRLHVAKAGKHTLKVAGTKKTSGAVMNLKAVTLRPVSE